MKKHRCSESARARMAEAAKRSVETYSAGRADARPYPRRDFRTFLGQQRPNVQ